MSLKSILLSYSLILLVFLTVCVTPISKLPPNSVAVHEKKVEVEGGLVPYKSDVPSLIREVEDDDYDDDVVVLEKKTKEKVLELTESEVLTVTRRLFSVIDRDIKNNDGQYDIIFTPEGLAFGLDPKNGEMAWLDKFDPINYNNILGYGLHTGGGSHKILVNATDYKELFEKELLKTLLDAEYKAFTTIEKETAVLVVDLRDGKVIYTHELNDTSISNVGTISSNQGIKNSVELDHFYQPNEELFCIVRIQFKFKSVCPTSGKLSIFKALGYYAEFDPKDKAWKYSIQDPLLSRLCGKPELRSAAQLFFLTSGTKICSSPDMPHWNILPPGQQTSSSLMGIQSGNVPSIVLKNNSSYTNPPLQQNILPSREVLHENDLPASERTSSPVNKTLPDLSSSGLNNNFSYENPPTQNNTTASLTISVENDYSPGWSTSGPLTASLGTNSPYKAVCSTDHSTSKKCVLINDYTTQSLVKIPSSVPEKGELSYRRYKLVISLCIAAVVVASIIYEWHLFPTKNHSSSEERGSKRKKTRKQNKYALRNEKVNESISPTVEESTNEDFMEPWLNIPKRINGNEGRRIGKLVVFNTEIAKGSNGTVVLEGVYNGRPVAVKRIVKAHHDVACKEIHNLIASDQHQNVVRWYGSESDSDFLYLSLERCTCSLSDLIQICSEFGNIKSENSVNEYNVRLDFLKGINIDVALWKSNGFPSPQLLKVMRDIVSGLTHLHDLGIIHRDLKPHNVLINKDKLICAKLSDMGISKRLLEDASSLTHHVTGYGSSGWQAPEQLLHGRQTRAVDLFSLGCVLFFCITGGKHPFGDRLERDMKIVNNDKDLFMVEHIPEAYDLISQLLDPDSEIRPKASIVLQHPLFWNSEMRLSFLRDASDRVELEDREIESDILTTLESIAPVALGGNWDEKMGKLFLDNIKQYRRYKFDSVRDLLRVIRNKLNHYRELPKDVQELLGPVSDGFDNYFAVRFPRLLTEVYKVIYKHCAEEECFWKYFRSSLV